MTEKSVWVGLSVSGRLGFWRDGRECATILERAGESLPGMG